MHAPDASNTPKINAQLASLERIRRANGVRMGWNPDEIPPPHANALAKAGLCVIVVTPDGRIVKPVESG